MQPQSLYKKYRIFLSVPGGQYIVATSNTVNDLVRLTSSWLSNTSAGQYIAEDARGYVVLQQLDPKTGAYRGGQQLLFEDKQDIITQLRLIGGR